MDGTIIHVRILYVSCTHQFTDCLNIQKITLKHVNTVLAIYIHISLVNIKLRLVYTSASTNTISTATGDLPLFEENTCYFLSTFTEMDEESWSGSMIAKGSTFLGGAYGILMKRPFVFKESLIRFVFFLFNRTLC